MANVKKIDWTFIDYLTFINAVVEKTIENAIEYKNFYLTLTAANMFYGYEPTVDENGSFSMNEVWNDLRHFNGIKDENGETIFEGIDLYRMLREGAYYFDDKLLSYNENVIIEDILPIDYYIFKEMCDTITDKIDEYNNHDTIKESITNLMNTISNFVDNMEKKYENVDIAEVGNKMENFAKTVKELDYKETARQLGYLAHEAAQNEKKENNKKKE